MAIPKLDEPQNDFSAGELDPEMKRSGSPVAKIGGRIMSNWRLLNSRKKMNRPGKSVLAVAGGGAGRVEEITINNNIFAIGFGNGSLGIFNASGVLTFFTSLKADGITSIPWNSNTLGGINYAIIGLSIYITYPDGAPNNVPQILTWDGVSQTSTWTLSTYAETITAGGQKRTGFYRISPKAVTLQPSGTSGIVNLTFSQNVLVAGMVGTRMRYCNRQMQIKTVTNGTQGTATVVEPLPPAQGLTLTNPVGVFNIGDLVAGSVTGASGIVTSSPKSQQISFGFTGQNLNVGDSVSGGTSGATGIITQVATFGYFSPFVVVSVTSGSFINGEVITDTTTSSTFTSTSVTSTSAMTVQLLPGATTNIVNTFTTADTVVGPSGSATISGLTTLSPQPVSVWDDEVMNTFRGFPSSVFYDQSRLGFCNVPASKSAIIWSAVGLPNDLYPDAQPDDAIFELMPENPTVFYVIPGMESSEFVFTDRSIHYIPINVNNPLKPGSVAFNKLSDYGCAPNVQPRRAEQTIVYIKAGGSAIGAVQAPGAYYRPYVVDSISEMHSHLFTASPPIAIAVPSGNSSFEELYIYIVLANGNLVVGHYNMRNGLLEPGPEGKPSVGWVPWNGVGVVGWVSATGGAVLFSSNYAPNGISPVFVLEGLDANQLLDAGVLVNQPPTGLQMQIAHSAFSGNMTVGGGLAGAFNGNRSQTSGFSAVIDAADGFVGIQCTAAAVAGLAIVFPPTDTGFALGGSGPITFQLRAKQTSPASSTDGTLIGSTTITNVHQSPVIINPSAYSTQTWAFIWIHISQAGATALGIAQVFLETGPMWWLANGSVTLIDNGGRFMGTYIIDAAGNLIPQFVGSENLASPNLVAGQPWISVFEPFLPSAPGGPDQQQRLRRRKIARALVSVQNSSGFLMQTISRPGAPLTQSRIPAYFVGDDATQPAPLREDSYKMRPPGRGYDPRFALAKDTPGPLTVVEVGLEVTI